MWVMRVVVWITRLGMIPLGLVILVVGLSYFWSGNLATLPALVVGMIYLWPFRLIKRVEKLELYYRILWPTSLIEVILSWVGAFFLHYSRWGVFLETVVLVVNLWAVRMYIQHRMDRRIPNVFLTVRSQLVVAAVIVVGVSCLGTYWLGGSHYTKTGRQWVWGDGLAVLFPMSSEKRWAAPTFTQQAWSWECEPSYSNSTRDGRLNVRLVCPLRENGEIELSDGAKRVVKITYGVGGLQRISTFDQQSGVEMVSHDSTVGWRQDDEGNWIPKINDYRASNGEKESDPLRVEVNYLDQDKKWRLNKTQVDANNFLEIAISKRVDYPETPKLKLLPMYRQNLPWELGVRLKEKEQVIKLVEGIVVWYR